MPLYKKVLYLDTDIIINQPLTELFNIDFENNQILAVKDATAQILYIKEFKERYEHIKNCLGIKEETDYFNSGMIMFNIPAIDKAIFLIDRKDLDTQTTMAFQTYANNDLVDVDETDNVMDLKKKLKSDDRQVIVTTIQKLQILISKRLKEGTPEYNKIRNFKIAFVVDECHRAVTPKTKRELERFFGRSLWYGFTGTPRFAENPYPQMGDLPRTTEELYGKCLHRYTIQNAIHDNAVLGFQVEHLGPKNIENETDARAYDNETHMLRVLDIILNKSYHKLGFQNGKGRTYEGLLTTSSIQLAQKYYELLTRVKNGETDLEISEKIKQVLPDFPKFAITYSVTENEEGSHVNQEKMQKSLDDYNKMFGTIVTENMCDIIWNKNSRLNRITAWNNDTVLNVPSQIIYIRNKENNKAWTLNSNILPNKNYYYITYGFGYAKYQNVSDGILQESDIFVPLDKSACINKIRFKNTTSEYKDLKILVYFKTVLGEDEISTLGNIYVEKKNNIIVAKNYIGSTEFQKLAYITSNRQILNFTKSKKIFLGNGNLTVPDSLFKEDFENQSGIGNCIGLEFEIKLEAYEEKFLNLIIGQENTFVDIEKQAQDLCENNKEEILLNEVYRNWINLNNTLNIQTPDDDINIMGNGWLIYQTIDCRIWAKTAFYQSGGAYGFRDQLQDCLGMKYLDIDMLKEQILKCAEHQFIEGDVLHWWHEETKRGCRTRFSDDLLWLPYGVCEYIKVSDNYNILDEQISYLKGESLKEGKQELYSQFFKTEEQESLYEHCLRAINRSLNFGENGFPKIGSGDWNDGFSNIGVKGKGESVWLRIFLI